MNVKIDVLTEEFRSVLEYQSRNWSWTMWCCVVFYLQL